MKIKKGDQVQIITGKDRGKRGKVLRVLVKSGKVIVEGVNIVKKHMRPRREGERGQRIEIPSPFSVSNAMIVCAHCGKPTRIGMKTTGEKKSRVCKKCKAEI